ncbi:gastrula zinc finger protein XlCGF53.1-like isoform X3 [Periplaneta americana]|uniref:gastrula zinc finger protein XlCGF53.1-like isoform X3 n=1 Tax=Periplaneta americana TaxID=6978 RepID=UPI0037E86D19
MPKTCCCVPLCANRGGHVFPKDTAVRKKWLLNIKREKWTLSKTSVVCSNHFTPDDYISSTLRGGNKPLQRKLKRDAVPSVFPWNKRSTDADKERIFTRMRKKFYNVKNMDIVKVEPDEEEPVKGWLPPVKPEPQDPLDVNDERRESWGWNLNVIDSSSKHTQAKNEDLPWNAPEVKEELTIEDYELKLPGTKHVADNINTVTLKVEADEESVKIQLPPVKTEFQDPLDVTDEGVVPWKWNLNVTDSSFVHKQMKVENLPQKESLLNKETNEELTVDSRQTKPSNDKSIVGKNDLTSAQLTEDRINEDYWRSSLKTRLSTRTRGQSFKCRTCGLRFANRRDINRHAATHTNGWYPIPREEPFVCEQCGKCCNQQNYLDKQIPTHAREKCFKCRRCGLRLTNRRVTNRKRNNDTGSWFPFTTEKPLECEQCGRCFSEQSDLDEHIHVHTNEKAFKCRRCGLLFKNRRDVNRHAATHTNGWYPVLNT